MSKFEIKRDDITDPRVHDLLNIHLANAYALTPAEHVHALDVSELQMPSVTFWTLWREDTLLGCGALKELDKLHGEVKSMHTYEKFRGQGLGGFILDHIIQTAKMRGYTRLSLETGHPPIYSPALRLYEKFGFKPCFPFADYTSELYSRYLTLSL